MMQLPSNDVNVKIVYEKARAFTRNNKINESDIIMLVVQLIPIVQNVVTDGHKGSYKKSLVLTVLALIVEDSKLESADKYRLNLLIQTTVPITIDTMINVAKGNIDLKKHAKSCFSCFF